MKDVYDKTSKMKNPIFILLIFALLISCSNSQKDNECHAAFFPDDLSGYKDERLIFEIKATFSECGEWGGHKETLLIYAGKDKEFHLKYKLWNVNCDSTVEYNDGIGTYYAPLIYLIDSTSLLITNDHKQAICKFTHDMVDAKFREVFPGHAGNTFEVYKYPEYNETSFKIQVYGFDSIILRDYLKLLELLKLDKFGRNSGIEYASVKE